MTHPVMRQVTRDLAKALQSRTDALPVLGLRFGSVTTVTAGAASDGGALATVNVGGTQQQMGYLASYTPRQGDTVAVLIVARYPLILGRVAGLPAF